MNWIKTHYDRVVLAIVSALLLGSSLFLANEAIQSRSIFVNLTTQVKQSDKIPGVPVGELTQAQNALENPTLWTFKKGNGSLFVSEKYLIEDGKPVLLLSGTVHPPVPNEWFIQHGLDLTDSDVLNQDPDKDGFTNLEEWRAGTDPSDPKSHPSYLTKLKIKKFIQKPFRLKFNSYDGDPTKPSAMTFAIDAVDLHQPTQFCKIGEAIEGTKFKIGKFVYKIETDANGIENDISELTVVNADEGKSVVLIYQKVVNSPDSYALLKYLWNGDEITVKKDKTFLLKPDNDEYKLIDISPTEALIENSKGEKIKIYYLP